MKKTSSIKRTAVVLSAFIGSAFLFTGVSYVNAESDTGLKTINYGTSENMIFADKGFAAFSVTDEDGNAFSDGEFVITDSEGSPVASWRGNPVNQNFSYAGGASLIESKSKVLVYGKQLPDFTGGNGYTRTTSVKTGENTATLISPDGAGSFIYGQTFESTSRYIIYGETELTVPAHSFGMYSDAAWSDRAVQWGFDIF